MITQPRDVMSMADAIARLVADADLRRRLGRAAQRTVERNCTTASMIAEYEQIYLTLCGAWRADPDGGRGLVGPLNHRPSGVDGLVRS